jgi:hypothetical protein
MDTTPFLIDNKVAYDDRPSVAMIIKLLTSPVQDTGGRIHIFEIDDDEIHPTGCKQRIAIVIAARGSAVAVRVGQVEKHQFSSTVIGLVDVLIGPG